MENLTREVEKECVILFQKINNGSLKAPYLESNILTSRIAWVKRYIYTDERPWEAL